METVDAKERFKFLSLLGEGSFGKVFKVEEKSTKKLYALKVIFRSDIDQMRKEFRTIQLLGNKCSKGLLCYHEIFKNEDGKFCILMDYVQGQDMFDLVVAKGHLTAKQTIIVAKHLIKILKMLHDSGFAHGDLKPESIIFNAGRMTLIDMGALCSTDSSDASDFDASVCNDNNNRGTMIYQSPEILKLYSEEEPVPGNYLQPSDIWSLGVTLFLFLHGAFPFFGLDPSVSHEDFMEEVVERCNVESADSGNKALDDLINSMLTCDVKKRPKIGTLYRKIMKIKA